MTVERQRQRKKMFLSMHGHVEKIIQDHGENTRIRTSPCTKEILDRKDSPSLNETDKKFFASLLMRLMYPIRMVHPDMHFTASVLAIFMSKPTQDDLKHLYHLLGYMKGKRTSGLLIDGSKYSGNTHIDWSIDASHGTHHDGKFHDCIIGYVQHGDIRNIVYFRTFKGKHVTLSSTESEISTVSEGVKIVLIGNQLQIDLGFPPTRPAYIEQDNESAITMNIENGGAPRRSQHIKIRGLFVCQYIVSKEIKLVSTPGTVILADLGTKPHNGPTLERMRAPLNIIDKCPF